MEGYPFWNLKNFKRNFVLKQRLWMASDPVHTAQKRKGTPETLPPQFQTSLIYRKRSRIVKAVKSLYKGRKPSSVSSHRVAPNLHETNEMKEKKASPLSLPLTSRHFLKETKRCGYRLNAILSVETFGLLRALLWHCPQGWDDVLQQNTCDASLTWSLPPSAPAPFLGECITTIQPECRLRR